VARARTAFEQDPESFVVEWELGMAYHWNKQYEDAIAVLEPMWAATGPELVTDGAGAGIREMRADRGGSRRLRRAHRPP
jgi:hypothetical protein